MKPRLLRPSFFYWLIPTIILIMAYLTYGTPYVIWSYDWRNNGLGYSQIDQRYYTRCSYLGRKGLVTEYPTNGTCDWLRFPERGAQ